MKATAIAHANIALAKYWGKCDERLNLPAVPSVSVTLEPLTTTTTVELSSKLREDVLVLDGETANPAELGRANQMLADLRRRAGSRAHARVSSRNAFPTAAGLASSASGFAALAAAAAHAYELELSAAELSAIARRASASAARSIFGGYVLLPAGRSGDASLAAHVIAEPGHFDVRVVVAITTRERKRTSSTDGMLRTQRTSPYYDAWCALAPELVRRAVRAIRARDLTELGPIVEQSALAMHASALAARPGVLYFAPSTLAALATVHRLRERNGVPVFATMDAGPHVKAVCAPDDARRVARALARTPGVEATIVARPGPGVSVS